MKSIKFGDQCETLTLTKVGAVAHITFTRPDQLNKFDTAQHHDFVNALTFLRGGEGGVRAVVLAAEGRVFSAGGDVAKVRRAVDDFEARTAAVTQGLEIMNDLLAFPLPIVSAIQGDVMGLGANVVLGTDAVIAWRGARMADPHVKIGLVAGDGGAFLWPTTAGMLRAKRYLLTGDPITAEQAYAFGMVTDLVEEPEDVLPLASEIAQRIASLPPLAVQGTKKALNRLLGQRAGEVLELSLQLEAMTMSSQDLYEAATAFLEKRPGVYRGN